MWTLVTSFGTPFVTAESWYTATTPTISAPLLLLTLDTLAKGVVKATGVCPFKVTA